MTDRELVLETLKRSGKLIATQLQSRAKDMTGTEIIAEENYIPSFDEARLRVNMIDRPIGFICRSAAGRVVKLIQPYDSNIYTQQPEALEAHWGFYWSHDPAKALPFVALSTSPYNTGDCCTYEGKTWRSGQDNNVWAPGTVGVKWEVVQDAGN